MVMWVIIFSLLLIGLTLLVVEIIFIPGTTVVGILGVIFSIVGIVITFKHFGSETGYYVLTGTGIATIGALYYSFKSGTWNKLALNSSIKSKVNEGSMSGLRVGDEGITVSSLKPSGKAEFNGENFEVRTTGNYVEPKSKVRIIRIESQQILVEQIK